ncbi:MAG: 5'/3'-nucleotidase SurE [Alphaproteobacteria bacterium]|nr:5'/3'-nucleotidase SurE [Alphaproteobacteria bacterium]
MTETIRLPRVLLTNDDGVNATGLHVLAEVAQEFAHEVWIVAPEHDHSGAGQNITLHAPLRCTQLAEHQWEISGTPGDCIALAVSHLMADKPPSLVLSGINAGANVGDEVNMSGTIGAALTALVLGVPAIAISQAYNETRSETPWDTTRAVLPKILRSLLAEGWRKETCLSVNIPDKPADELTGFSWAVQSHKSIAGINVEKRTSPRQEDYFWLSLDRRPPLAVPNSDSAILRRGEVSVTALTLDRSLNLGLPSVLFSEAETLAAVDE